jgi:hypothetical protein
MLLRAAAPSPRLKPRFTNKLKFYHHGDIEADQPILDANYKNKLLSTFRVDAEDSHVSRSAVLHIYIYLLRPRPMSPRLPRAPLTAALLSVPDVNANIYSICLQAAPSAISLHAPGSPPTPLAISSTWTPRCPRPRGGARGPYPLVRRHREDPGQRRHQGTHLPCGQARRRPSRNSETLDSAPMCGGNGESTPHTLLSSAASDAGLNPAEPTASLWPTRRSCAHAPNPRRIRLRCGPNEALSLVRARSQT